MFNPVRESPTDGCPALRANGLLACGVGQRHRRAHFREHRKSLIYAPNRAPQLARIHAHGSGRNWTKKTPLIYKKAGFSGRYRTVMDAILAERVGFEPTVILLPRLISSQVHSTTLPPLLCVEAYDSSRLFCPFSAAMGWSSSVQTTGFCVALSCTFLPAVQAIFQPRRRSRCSGPSSLQCVAPSIARLRSTSARSRAIACSTPASPATAAA